MISDFSIKKSIEGNRTIIENYQSMTVNLVSISNSSASKDQVLHQAFILCKNLFRSEKEQVQNGRKAQMLT
tara:strand:- start:302 stop:514 length:213 start_codon:yes stop_codon:yes gene_type:complete